MDRLQYIKRQRKKLFPIALEHPALFYVMLTEKMIPKKELLELMEQIDTLEHPEIASMLLDSQHKLLKPKHAT